MAKFYQGLAIAAVIGFSVNAWASFYEPHIAGELIIKLNENNKIGQKNNFSFLSDYGVEVKKILRDDLLLVRVGLVRPLAETIKELSDDERVSYSGPNYTYKIVRPMETSKRNFFLSSTAQTSAPPYTPSDPKFFGLWGMNNNGRNGPTGEGGVPGADIAALAAWNLTLGDKRIKIAVIDTGIEYTHPDLRENIWENTVEKNGKVGVDDDGNGLIDDIYGYDFANEDGDPLDGHGHGTHCAGTIGALHNNDEGVAGVIPNVSLVAIKFLTDHGTGTTANAIRAIDYGISINVDIMSNSWGGAARSEALLEAIQRASDHGILFVAAAGNSGNNNDRQGFYPANYKTDNMISVAAHTAGDFLASFSNFGRNTVHIAAPGDKIISCNKNSGYATFSGTSMATPHVAGAIGLLLSETGRMEHGEMRERLLKTSVPITSYRGKILAGGRLNLFNLLTDTRPLRNTPNADDWEILELEEVFQSQHPYLENQKTLRKITVPSAKFIRVIVKKYEFELKYDYLEISGKDGQVVEKVSGVGRDYTTEYVEGDEVQIRFSSDSSVQKWGHLVEEIQVIYEK